LLEDTGLQSRATTERFGEIPYEAFREFVLETFEQLAELNLLERRPGGGLAAASLFGLTANLLRCFVEQEPSKAIQQAVLLRESAN
jgi:hypothetical protein